MVGLSLRITAPTVPVTWLVVAWVCRCTAGEQLLKIDSLRVYCRFVVSVRLRFLCPAACIDHSYYNSVDLECTALTLVFSLLTQVIMRIVVKENFGRNLCNMLVEDIRIAVGWLDDNPTQHANMRVSVKVVVALI